MTNKTFRVGIDIGGTFTDAVVITDDGEMRIFKSPSTPKDSSIGMLNKCLHQWLEVEGEDVILSRMLQKELVQLSM